MSLVALEPGAPKDGAFWPEPYQSQAMPLLFDYVANHSEGKVLDVGPVCSENITYLAQRIKSLYVCDLFLRMQDITRGNASCQPLWRHLDYRNRLFEAIFLWDLPDRLEDSDLARLVERCRDMSKPGGRLFVCVQPERSAGNLVYSLVIGPNYRLYPRRQTHLRLDARGRPNRELLGAFESHFKPLESFIYRNGFREFIFKLK